MTTTTGNFATDKLADLYTLMQGYVDRGEVAGLVTVLHRAGETHIEKFGVQSLKTKEPMEQNTIFRIASMTKPVVAVAAMILVEDGKLNLDEPVTHWLPEVASMRVLRKLDSQLDDTVAANRPISLRDLLTFRLGSGFVLAQPGTYPIQKAMADAGLMPSPIAPRQAPDQWMKTFANLPLVYQPGERWMYHTGSDVLGVLIGRAAGSSLENFLRKRIFEPLGMKDTAFSVPQEKLDRLATSYHKNTENKLTVFDEPSTGAWASAPLFQSGGGGLVSTANDFLAFGRMLLDRGLYGKNRILKESTVEEMLVDQLRPEQKRLSPFYPGFWDTHGWGLGFSLVTAADEISSKPGRFGWDGGLGTSWRSDPREDMVGILLAQTNWTAPVPPNVCVDFWKAAYQSIKN
jgi:CubicO group peptidase (beta-lactamase class C family)